MNHELAQKIKQIKCLILDVDGVLTDGKIIFSPHGDEYKVFHVQDGVAIKQLQANGVTVAVISGRSSPAVNIRMQELGVNHIYLGQDNKCAAYNELKSLLNLNDKQCAHMGDDLADLKIMQFTGLSIAPANAVTAVKEKADWITTRAGGDAAVREVSDAMLVIQSQPEPQSA